LEEFCFDTEGVTVVFSSYSVIERGAGRQVKFCTPFRLSD